jgi:hypothetical protein
MGLRFMVNDCGDFIGRHWGDFVGLLILYTGVALILWAAAPDGKQTGQALVLAAMGILKLRSNDKKTDGNGNGSAAH